ncbi:uncharacterized protein LOC9630912 isoform X1 [Selaginella moellendorffii]|uniref:uncharacterized protein LOC9630912 isoform X1 n=1 Tax=Selaginella moellendorffii TaxID=88036 RepID=UPI000D1C81A5|nr:uncharacterized protein LOC9630912 isoform X1 [Selaginella moellendorffii]|eukprot:XP_024528276.1 uncharacterized protein LOC9630912 isoform X1 [Selaginella moellendorffii]
MRECANHFLAGEILPVIKLEAMEPYEMGLAIGKRFSAMIERRLEQDPLVRSQLVPFSRTSDGEQLVDDLSATNRNAFPRYWDELRGIADGSGASFLELLLLNLRKEIFPFLPTEVAKARDVNLEAVECSDILVCRPDLTVVAHNEDADVSVEGHAFLLHAVLPHGVSFFAYTYAGELPTCAFGFNSFGVAFTLNAVPLAPSETVRGGVGRNFVSRDLLEAKDFTDALKRIQNPTLSAGHCYNLLDINAKMIFNVETASKQRFTYLQISEAPYFHANMYLRLDVSQVSNDSSLHREKRAAEMPKNSLEEILAVLGDGSDELYPIYMAGPKLCTLVTVVFDASSRTMTLYHGNPAKSSTLQLEISLDSV